MKRLIVTLACLLAAAAAGAQSGPGQGVFQTARYHCKAGRPDSAFHSLFRAAATGWGDYLQLLTDPELRRLRTAADWPRLCLQVRNNMLAKDPASDTATADQLAHIYADDQRYRGQLASVTRQYGDTSAELGRLRDTIRRYDADNLRQVTSLLDAHGWMSPRQIGLRGVSAVFLVLQHADSATQLRYYPMLAAAAAKGELPRYKFALFEDRVALGSGRRQRYGSQVACTAAGCRLRPLEDPLHVDERRAAVGLEPLADYLRQWNIQWDAAAFAARQAAEEEAAQKQ